jgi:hypothetical protein
VVGFDCDVSQHHDAEVSGLHEQRHDWADRVVDPYSKMSFSNDWLHTNDIGSACANHFVKFAPLGTNCLFV